MLHSWIDVKTGSDFPIQNLPFGIFRAEGRPPAVASRIGDNVIDIYDLAKRCFLPKTGIDPEIFNRQYLNEFISLGKPAWKKLRESLTDLFSPGNDLLREYVENTEQILYPVDKVEMLMPVKVGDYTDFYSSENHARNLGSMFRDPGHALSENWKHLPAAYHGRTSSIVVSGTPIYRPNGQILPDGASMPVFGPTQQLDFELEVAFIAGKSTSLGDTVSTADAEDHIFGLVLFNDLSARDIQKWEYFPLGPFLGKSFGSVISPWVIPLDALEPFRTAGPEQQPAVLPYLTFAGNHHFDINLEVSLKPDGGEEMVLSRTNYRNIYWNIVQQLAHQTVNGCNINIGDIYSSGAISGQEPGSFGSMIELTWQGSRPLKTGNGKERTFLEDNDTVILRGYAEKEGLRIGFGEASAKIFPAK